MTSFALPPTLFRDELAATGQAMQRVSESLAQVCAHASERILTYRAQSAMPVNDPSGYVWMRDLMVSRGSDTT